jgi:hypothetical protein
LAALDGAAVVSSSHLCNLEPLGLSAGVTRFLPAITSLTVDESGMVQVTTLAARVNIWASSDVMDARIP